MIFIDAIMQSSRIRKKKRFKRKKEKDECDLVSLKAQDHVYIIMIGLIQCMN